MNDGSTLKAYVDGKGLVKQDLARKLGMSKQNLYQLFKTKTFSPDTVELLETHFKTKWAKIKGQPVNIDVPRETLRVVKGGADKYVRLLEDNDQFFKYIVKSNLVKADYVQGSILAHLKAIVQEYAEDKAGGDPEKKERIMEAWGKRIAENLGLPVEMDILAVGK